MSPGSPPDWTLLLEKARQEGVSALLFHSITAHHLEKLIPRNIYGTLAKDYYDNLKRNMSVIGALREVLTSFRETVIPSIILKGMALAEQVYPNIALRGMSDVDILVRKDDLLRADNCLATLGYTARDSSAAQAIHNPPGYLASLEYRNNSSPMNLHLHWHTVNTSVPATIFVDHMDLNRFWEQAVETRVADSDTLVLSPEHTIIYLCEHGLRVGHSFDRLILTCDIFFTLRTFATVIDWNFLCAESRRLNLSRFVYYALTLVKHHTSLDLPDGLLEKLRPAVISRGEEFFLHLQLRGRRIKGSSYFIYLAMNRGLVAKTRFIFRTLCPPPAILMQRRHQGESSGKISLYGSRIWEALSHLRGILH
jgi:hypothetical protein